jgi:hypothetical protein
VRVDFDVAGVDHEPLEIRLVDEFPKEVLPESLVSPSAETTVGVFPVPVVRWQIAPRSARSQDPEDGVEEESVVFGSSSPLAFLSGEMRFKEFPVFIR